MAIELVRLITVGAIGERFVMSIEISVLSNSRLSSFAEWQQAIDAEDFPLRLSTDAHVDEHGGTLKAYLRNKPTNVQYRVEDSHQLMKLHNELDFGHDWKYLISFPWIGDFDEFDTAWMVATAYARATSGVVFDPQERKVFKPAEAVDVVRDMERTRPEAEAALRNHVEQLSAKSPEAKAAIRAFMQRQLKQANQA